MINEPRSTTVRYHIAQCPVIDMNDLYNMEWTVEPRCIEIVARNPVQLYDASLVLAIGWSDVLYAEPPIEEHTFHVNYALRPKKGASLFTIHLVMRVMDIRKRML